MFNALVYDQDGNTWLQFRDPIEVQSAWRPEDMKGLLQFVDKASARGNYAVGYVSYEAASAFDPALTHFDPESRPLATFAIYDVAHPGVLSGGAVDLDLSPTINRADFESSIARVKNYLCEGDSYQVNFTHQLKGTVHSEPLDVFSHLFRAQPSPYAAFIDTDDFSICSVSPELFFETDGSHIRTEPMKGTRPRGRFSEEDARLKQELISSEKDRAENLMIVDMVRNDLGRIAEPGTVVTKRMFSVKRLPTVWQQISSVEAKTTASLDQIFEAIFPCASVTGAPKTRTMEIIRELETEPRGVYTGAIGLVKPGRKARFSVAIRTLTIEKPTHAASYGVGGGIIWDSDAGQEWQECLTKAAVLTFQRPEFELLETMRYEPEQGIYLLAGHLERLRQSAEYFMFRCDIDSIARDLETIASDKTVRLRLILAKDGKTNIECMQMPQTIEEVRLKIAERPVDSSNVFLLHKTTHRKVYEQALQDVSDCDDVILWNERGELTETTISNLYLEINGELLTPARESGLLAGTYRQKMLEEGSARETILMKDDLYRASRILVSNSVRDLVEATLINDIGGKGGSNT